MAGGLVGPEAEAKGHPDRRVRPPMPDRSGRAQRGAPAASSIAPACPWQERCAVRAPTSACLPMPQRQGLQRAPSDFPDGHRDALFRWV